MGFMNYVNLVNCEHYVKTKSDMYAVYTVMCELWDARLCTIPTLLHKIYAQ